MKSTVVWALVVVNALLLAAFVSRVSSPNAAYAQNQAGGAAAGQNNPPGAARSSRPGDYLLIPGEIPGGSTAVIYAIDTTNGMLTAFAYEDAVRRLELMPGRIDLGQVFAEAQRAGEARPAPRGNTGNRRTP